MCNVSKAGRRGKKTELGSFIKKLFNEVVLESKKGSVYYQPQPIITKLLSDTQYSTSIQVSFL